MRSATPHFIRCIKPNLGKTSGDFEATFVTAQLRYSGVLETVRIRQQGYSARLTFQDFLRRLVLLSVISAQ